jgi:hypothetical protein
LVKFLDDGTDGRTFNYDGMRETTLWICPLLWLACNIVARRNGIFYRDGLGMPQLDMVNFTSIIVLLSAFLVGTSVYFLYVVRSHSQRMSLAFYYIAGLAQAQGSLQLVRSLAEIQVRYLSLFLNAYSEIKPFRGVSGSDSVVVQVQSQDLVVR